MMNKNKVRLWIAAGLILLCLGVFLWLPRTKPERPQPARNMNAVSPGAMVSTTAGSVAVSSSPVDGTSKGAPGNVPLQVGRHAANAEFPYPFLGSVKAYLQPQVLRLHTSDGTLAEFPIKVFYTESGNFIRAEFVKPGAGDFQSSVQIVEAASKQSFQEVTGLPEKTLAVSLESLLDHPKMAWERATRFNVTYVLYKKDDAPPKPMILLNIFGMESLIASPPAGHEEAARRIRYVMNQEGEVQWADLLL